MTENRWRMQRGAGVGCVENGCTSLEASTVGPVMVLPDGGAYYVQRREAVEVFWIVDRIRDGCESRRFRRRS